MLHFLNIAAAVLAFGICGLFSISAVSAAPAPKAASTRPTTSSIPVARVWSGHPVGFCLLTHKERQFVAYYDAERHMTVASRPLSSTEWKTVRLPEQIGWDSHNYITLTIDDDDHLHLSGNMHNVPLVYFRTTRPLDIKSLERVTSMTGKREKRCTYPRFFRGAGDELIFTYRDGGSGNGSQIYNVYDLKTREWKPLLDTVLTDGEGEMSAYLHGPRLGPDGYFHLVWVWRDTPDCETNHHLSYARSRDLRKWETSTGTQLRLPLTLTNSEVIDPVPPGGGLLNGKAVLSFDRQNRPVISYHKYDGAGMSQIFVARLEQERWNIVPATDWTERLEFSGRGSIGFPLSVAPLKPGRKGELVQSAKHPTLGGTWVLDEETLKLKHREAGQKTAKSIRDGKPGKLKKAGRKNEKPDVPAEPGAGLQARSAGDTGKSGEPGVRYSLHWATLGANRDRPREGPHPEPSLLEVVRTAPR